MSKKYIMKLICLLLLCISITTYAETTGFIQFSLYSDKEVHTTVAFDIINDASNEVSHYYLYQENGHVTTLQLPVGNYHLSGDKIKESAFTVEESPVAKKVYVEFKNNAENYENKISSEASIYENEESEERTDIGKIIQTETQNKNHSLFRFIKENIIYILILILAVSALFIIKKHEDLDKEK